MKAAAPSQDEMRRFLDEFAGLATRKRVAQFEQMEQFLVEFRDAQHARRQKHAGQFNVFSLLNVESDEVRHSSILAWLLDTWGSHGQGNLFLRHTVKLWGLDIPESALCDYRVRTEFSGHEATVDVLVVKRQEFLIYVENKVYAAEQELQVDREFNDMRQLGCALRIPEDRQCAVFLTPSGRTPQSGDASRWIAASHSELAAALHREVEQIEDTKLRSFLQDWIRTVKSWRFG